jgi:hypothetical protein
VIWWMGTVFHRKLFSLCFSVNRWQVAKNVGFYDQHIWYHISGDCNLNTRHHNRPQVSWLIRSVSPALDKKKIIMPSWGCGNCIWFREKININKYRLYSRLYLVRVHCGLGLINCFLCCRKTWSIKLSQRIFEDF